MKVGALKSKAQSALRLGASAAPFKNAFFSEENYLTWNSLCSRLQKPVHVNEATFSGAEAEAPSPGRVLSLGNPKGREEEAAWGSVAAGTRGLWLPPACCPSQDAVP